jgi:hypothetical protein
VPPVQKYINAVNYTYTQKHWVSGLCQSSGILNTRKHNVSVSFLRLGGYTYSLWGQRLRIALI